MQRPATEGKLGMQCLLRALKTGKGCGGIDVLKGLPNGGVVVKSNAGKFKPSGRIEVWGNPSVASAHRPRSAR